jgi:hypothetical protein
MSKHDPKVTVVSVPLIWKNHAIPTSFLPQPVPSIFKAFFLSEKWSHKYLSDSIFLTSLPSFPSSMAISMFASVAAGRPVDYGHLSFLKKGG